MDSQKLTDIIVGSLLAILMIGAVLYFALTIPSAQTISAPAAVPSTITQNSGAAVEPVMVAGGQVGGAAGGAGMMGGMRGPGGMPGGFPGMPPGVGMPPGMGGPPSSAMRGGGGPSVMGSTGAAGGGPAGRSSAPMGGR